MSVFNSLSTYPSVFLRCRNIQHMQSCLSKITSIRERDLDLAQKYFTMLYVNEEVGTYVPTSSLT